MLLEKSVTRRMTDGSDIRRFFTGSRCHSLFSFSVHALSSCDAHFERIPDRCPLLLLQQTTALLLCILFSLNEINSRISPFHLRPFSRCGPKVHLRDAIDDVEEVSLETCTTDESSINIGLSQQILGVGTLHGSSILDPDSRGNLRGDIFGNPGTNIFVSFLRHLWSSSKPGSNGPN